MTLSATEFIRRFLQHTLPDSFHRIRHYGFLANGHRVPVADPLPITPLASCGVVELWDQAGQEVTMFGVDQQCSGVGV